MSFLAALTGTLNPARARPVPEIDPGPKAYKSGKFSKPRNALGIAKDLPDADMEKLLLANMKITDDDLRQLASLRARTVKDIIVRQQKVEPERIFLIEPKSLTPEQKEKLRNSRVDFSLK